MSRTSILRVPVQVYTAIVDFISVPGEYNFYFPELAGLTGLTKSEAGLDVEIQEKLDQYLTVLKAENQELPVPFFNGNRRLREFDITTKFKGTQYLYVGVAYPDTAELYSSFAPDLRGFNTGGDNMSIVRSNANKLLYGWLEDFHNDGDPFPLRKYEGGLIKQVRFLVGAKGVIRKDPLVVSRKDELGDLVKDSAAMTRNIEKKIVADIKRNPHFYDAERK